MRTGFTQAVPVNETVTSSQEERAEAHRRYRVLDMIVEAAQAGDTETVKALASTL